MRRTGFDACSLRRDRASNDHDLPNVEVILRATVAGEVMEVDFG
jgi:hypothetical protein